MKLSTVLGFSLVAVGTALAATPAYAAVVGAPAPLIGAGIPAVAFLASGYAALRRRRAK